MRFKQDWEEARKRLQAFWEYEMSESCCIAAVAPREKRLPCKYDYRAPKNLEQQWLDVEFRYEQMIHQFAGTFYAGEAFPLTIGNLGPGVIAGCMGNGFALGEETVWFDTDPFLTDWSKLEDLHLDESSFMWKKLTSMTKVFSERSQGDYIVGISDLGGNFDILAALRGTQNLLLDLVDHKDEVKQAITKIDTVWMEAFTKLSVIIGAHSKGYSSWMPLWSPASWYPLQCDFSAMISPAMFEEFVVPSLAREADFLDNAIFHLDGPGALPHLDMILEIPGIHGIQWTPGAKIQHNNDIAKKDEYDLANPEWFPMYRKIQDRGKYLILLGVSPADVETLLSKVSHRGLFIFTQCESEQQAEAVVSTSLRSH
jgi:5-methyltetrahydrofolate--homocysteine methyltransferase